MSDICLPHTCTHTHQYGCKRTHIHVHTTHTHTHHTGQEGSWLKNMLPDTGTRTQRSPKPSATTSSGETRAIPGLGGDWTEDIVGGGCSIRAPAHAKALRQRTLLCKVPLGNFYFNTENLCLRQKHRAPCSTWLPAFRRSRVTPSHPSDWARVCPIVSEREQKPPAELIWPITQRS